MKHILTVLLFGFITIFCHAQTQSELNQQARTDYQKTEKEINVVYQKILKQYSSDTVFIKNLRAAQRLWIQFRDAQVKMKFPEREAGYYGSVLPMCLDNYKTNLTNERIKTLQAWLSGEEGDACAGSVMPKF